MKKVLPLICIVISLLLICILPGCKNDVNAPGITDKKEPLIVRSRLRVTPDKLNPFLTTKSFSLQVCNILFPTLLNFDPTTYELSPMLVKSRPEMKPITEGPYKGGATFTYELLEEAVWDNGQPVLASDYVFTLKALFNPLVNATAYQGLLRFIKDVKIDPNNPKKFTVYVDQIFRAEASTGIYLYPEHAYDSTGIMRQFTMTDLTDPAKTASLKADPKINAFAEKFNKTGSPDGVVESCGPYRLVEWETDQRIILEKKENWWGEKLVDQYPLLAAYPDEIIFKIIPDDVAAITAMKDQQIDVASKLPSSAFIEFKDSEAAAPFNFLNPDFPMYMYIGLNTRRPQLADKRVRRALAHLTDVNEIIETVQLGLAVPCAGSFPPNAPYTNKELKPIPFDIEKAKALLKEAGWKDSDGDGVLDKVIKGKKTPLQITVTHSPSETSANIVSIMKEDARKAGVVVESKVVARSELFPQLATRDFDAFPLAAAFDLDLFDPGSFWMTSSDTPSGQNRSGFGNSKTDAIINEIRSTNDDKRRKELYFELQEILYDEQPFIFLYTPKDRVVISKKFEHAKTTLTSPGYLENHFH